jgi:hypothetical protein
MTFLRVLYHYYVRFIIPAIINKHLYCYLYYPTSDDHMIDENGLAIIDEAPIVLGSNDYEMIESLRKLNVSRPIALTLACLVKGKVITSQEIEILTRLRQPEVSIAMRDLQKNNWIEVSEEKNQQVRVDRQSCTGSRSL